MALAIRTICLFEAPYKRPLSIPFPQHSVLLVELVNLFRQPDYFSFLCLKQVGLVLGMILQLASGLVVLVLSQRFFADELNKNLLDTVLVDFNTLSI